MKRLLTSFGLLAILLILLTSTVYAELPGTGWWSAVFIQNIETDSVDASVNLTAYPSAAGDDSVYGSSSFVFNFGQGLIYDPGKNPNYSSGGSYIGFDTALASGFEGSAVISASVPVAAVSEIANYNNGSVGGGGTASARYQGMSSNAISDVLMIPTIKNNYVNHTTTVYVQAANESADVTITFRMNDGNVYTQHEIIPANKMFSFDPSNAGVPSTDCGYDGNSSPCFGSAEIVSSTGLIAGTVIEHPHQGSPAGFALSTRALTASDQDTILYHPTTKNYFWRQMDAGATIMNVGTEPAYVKITLSVTNVDKYSSARIGNVYTDYEIIDPGESKIFSRWRENLGGMPSGTFAAAVIESVAEGGYTPQPLVGSTNDRKLMPAVPGGMGITLYNSYADNNKSNSLAAPILNEKVNGITSSITVQNVGTEAANMTFYYYEYGTDNVYVFRTTSPVEVGKATVTTLISEQNNGGKFTIVSGLTNFSELANKQFSVIVESSQPIIGLASEYAISQNRDMSNYEATNFAP